MINIELKKFGSVLTGREFGSQAFAQLKKEVGQNKVDLDFTGISSLGSSFGEEVVVPFAKQQEDTIRIRVTSKAVRDCIELIASDFKIRVEYL